VSHHAFWAYDCKVMPLQNNPTLPTNLYCNISFYMLQTLTMWQNLYYFLSSFQTHTRLLSSTLPKKVPWALPTTALGGHLLLCLWLQATTSAHAWAHGSYRAAGTFLTTFSGSDAPITHIQLYPNPVLPNPSTTPRCYPMATISLVNSPLIPIRPSPPFYRALAATYGCCPSSLVNGARIDPGSMGEGAENLTRILPNGCHR
jgi:hypothetical protein